MEIQALKGTKDVVGDSTGLAGAYSSVFYGVDGQEYRINGNEIKSVPSYIGIPWLAADSNLEQVGKYH
jgi:hypothetical protein